MMTRPHDPGPAAAREQAQLVDGNAEHPIASAQRGAIRVGTASWTDPTLTAPGVFYPRGATTAEDRLRYYASCFSLVEIDATYYALPTRRMAELWMERTPPDFTFDCKANALMTGQPTEISRLPADLRAALPESLASKPRIYGAELPNELYDTVWSRFIDALEPLRSSGKLGSVLLQYPRWFTPRAENREAILEAHERLGDLRGAVELRNGLWFTERNAERTLAFFEEHRIPFVMVDEPQGLRSSVPPMVAVTSPAISIVRFHGRRADTWEKRGISVAERFRYFYDKTELAEWVPRIEEAAAAANEVHVIMNNCYANYGTTNALQLSAMLGEASPTGS
ncbi:MAG TPA: DUF72 domain-containing protein [Gemmatimonadaceae bacterium]|nr:DUF72 domain-containing protein [Gemmatimonadaceae bacterium]